MSPRVFWSSLRASSSAYRALAMLTIVALAGLGAEAGASGQPAATGAASVTSAPNAAGAKDVGNARNVAGAKGVVDAPDVTVHAQEGVYHVAATFSVAQSAPVVFDVLTGYEQIPRYMPDVRSSKVIERGDGRAVVEQEAVARVMMFSKRVHLLLDVHEAPLVIRFRDRCGRSFERYEGAWTLTAAGTDRVDVRYELAARPSFDVPDFLLKRLLKRDAQEMIRRLREEMVRPR